MTSAPIDLSPSGPGAPPPPRDWFIVYLGRQVVRLVAALCELLSRIQSVAFSVFKTAKPLPQLPEPHKLTESSESDSEGPDVPTLTSVDSRGSITASTESEEVSESEPPFSKWQREDWELVIGVLKSMLTRLKKKSNPDDPVKLEEAELSRFREMHTKLLKVFERMPDEQLDDPTVQEFYSEYANLTRREPGFLDTIFHFLWRSSSPEVRRPPSPPPRNSSTRRSSSLGEPSLRTSGSPPRTPSPKLIERINSLSPKISPRTDLGGIPQVGNSCYMNAIMQIIKDKLPPLQRMEGEKDAEFEKRERLEKARELLVRVKDDPDAAEDEVWLAALVLRNLLFDTGIIKLSDMVGELGYFSQQDAAICASGLLQAVSVPIRSYYRIAGIAELYTRPTAEEPPMTEPYIRLLFEGKDQIQKLLDKKFAFEAGVASRSFPKHVVKDRIYPSENDTEVKVSPDCYEKTEKIELTMNPDGTPVLPEFLCLQLARFGNIGPVTHKNESHVEWPKDGIVDFKEAFKLPDGQSIRYKLTGAVLHHGHTLSGGHYTAYATRDGGLSWHHYNDQAVSKAYPAEKGAIPEAVLTSIANEGYFFYLEKV